MKNHYECWSTEAEGILGSIERLQQIGDWRFLQGDPTGAQRADYDDDGWRILSGELRWTTAAGTAWLRHDICFPESAEGIPLAGSAVDLIFLCPSGVEVFLDGESLVRFERWADCRPAGQRVLGNLEPGRRYVLALRFPSGDGLGLCRASFRVAAVDELAFELSAFVEELRFIHDVLLRKEPALGRRFIDIVKVLDVKALQKRKWQRILFSLRQAEEATRFFESRAKQYTVHLVGHSHIDMNWLWPWEHTIEICQRDFHSANELLKEHTDLHFSQSQAAAYDVVGQVNPSLLEEVRQRVRDGRWELTSSTWVEGDLNMAAGETLARQLLHGTLYTQETVGTASMVGWEPDTFGHPATYPQILSRAGIRFYYFKRGGKGSRLFWWEAPDGSRVLAYNDSDYNGEIRARDIVLTAKESASDHGLMRSLHVFGVGDHGGGPARRDILAKKRLDARPGLPTMRFSSTEDFFRRTLLEAAVLPVVKGELNTVFEGCYTTHADIKRYNREGENGLMTAETLATVCSAFGHPYPYELLRKAWKEVCFNQFHDIIAGTAIGASYEHSAGRARGVRDAARYIVSESLRFLAASVGRDGAEEGIFVLIVFNPLGWPRDDVVEAEVPPEATRPFHLIDEAGSVVPAQVEGSKLVFVARGVPAFGYASFRLIPGDHAPEPAAELTINKRGRMESPQFLLQVDPCTGVITRFFDKISGIDVLQPCPSLEGNAQTSFVDNASNVFRLFREVPHLMSSWVIGNADRIENLICTPRMQVGVCGPVRVALDVRHEFHNSAIEQRIVLYRDLRRVEFLTRVEWHERGSPDEGIPLLRVSFNLPFLAPEATYEIPFGFVRRPSLGAEVPALRWVDVSRDDRGVCLVNDCKYGHQAEAHKLSLTLLRSSYEPDAVSDSGLQHFGYALCPHHGTWEIDLAFRNAAEFNQPLLVVWGKGAGGDLPPSFGLLDLEPRNLVASALKRSEDGVGIVLRFYEVEGSGTTATLTSPLSLTGSEVNLLEKGSNSGEGRAGKAIRLTVSPFEIKTVLLEISSVPS